MISVFDYKGPRWALREVQSTAVRGPSDVEDFMCFRTTQMNDLDMASPGRRDAEWWKRKDALPIGMRAMVSASFPITCWLTRTGQDSRWPKLELQQESGPFISCQ